MTMSNSIQHLVTKDACGNLLFSHSLAVLSPEVKRGHHRTWRWEGLTDGGGSSLVLQERLEVDLNKKKAVWVGGIVNVKGVVKE